MPTDDHVKFEASMSPAGEDGPARLYVWVRRFHGDEELTGRYEVFEDLKRLDEFIARGAADGARRVRQLAGLAPLTRVRVAFAVTAVTIGPS
jgi:hypothetical protein